MNLLMVLAQTSKVPGQVDQTHVEYGTRYVLQVLDRIWEQATALNWLQAVIVISFGIIPLLYGWRIYKVLTVVGFGLLGLYIGGTVGMQFDKILLGSVIGTALLVVLALPLMRWAVCILGAVAGGLIASGIWYAFTLPEQFVWAGSLVGLVAGGMLSFVIFKLAVMLFTSFAGTSLIVVGVFSLIYQYETFINDPPTTGLNHFYYNQHWFFPLLLIFGTFLGVILQFRLLKSSKDDSVSAP
jgi:hypothetical protein